MVKIHHVSRSMVRHSVDKPVQLTLHRLVAGVGASGFVTLSAGKAMRQTSDAKQTHDGEKTEE